jgi:cobalt-zinc-cadmium efflux system outer membrane protein
MHRLGRRLARCLAATLWIAVALGSILSAGCVRPLGQAWREISRQTVIEEAAVRPADPSSTMAVDEKVSPREPVGIRASFQEIGDAPSPRAGEFSFLSDPPPDQGMTLEDVLQQTLDCHPLLHARVHEVEAARGRLVTAGLLPNPQWVLDSQSPVDLDDATILTTRLTFTLPTGRKRRWGMAAAEAGVARSQAALARETEVLLAEAADAAIEVLYLQELAVLQGELSLLAAKTAEVVTGRFQSGTTPYLATIRSRLDAAEIELQRLTTQGDLEEARVRLNRTAGLPPAPLVHMRGALVVEPIPSIRLERLLAEAERSRPELAESRAALLESQRLHAQARAEARPDLVFGPRVRDDLGPVGDRVGARIAMDVPVFDRNQGRITERAAMVRTQGAILDLTQVNTLSDVAAAYVELQDAQTRLDFHSLHVQPIVEQTEAAIRSADADKVLAPDQISELLEQVVRMRVEELELRYLHTRLRTRLEILLGCPLEDLHEAG